jgi:hypothetical protein
MASDTFHTIYPPYYTAATVEEAYNGDSITLNNSYQMLFAAHPVSMSWLRVKVSPPERKDIFQHIEDLLKTADDLSIPFVKVIRETRNRLETIAD